MRLIDADELIKQFHYGGIADTEEDKAWTATVRRTIKAQPTAYDIEDIIKQLEKEKERQKENAIDMKYRFGVVNGVNVSIGIVKGGVENDS